MNLPNKLSMFRIFLTIFIIAILTFPFNSMGIDFPKLFVGEQIVVDLEYLIAAILFVVASITDFLDGYIARKYNMITDFGKMLDSIADKVLVNSVLIILASRGTIHMIIPVVIIFRDTVVNSIKMSAGSQGKVVAASKAGKLKTATMMVGLTLTLIYNLPFELWNLRISDFLLILATVFSVVSGIQYYNVNKKYFTEEAKK